MRVFAPEKLLHASGTSRAESGKLFRSQQSSHRSPKQLSSDSKKSFPRSKMFILVSYGVLFASRRGE